MRTRIAYCLSRACTLNLNSAFNMVVQAFLFVIAIGAKLTEGYAQNDIGKCCSDCECKGYSLAGGTWTQENCCKSGNPCWCDQNNRCQPSCSSSSQQAQLGRCYSTKDCQQYSRAGGFWSKNDCSSAHLVVYAGVIKQENVNHHVQPQVHRLLPL